MIHERNRRSYEAYNHDNHRRSKIRLSVRPGQPKKSLDNQKY